MSGNELEKSESEKIGALWKLKSKKGMEYLSGQVNGERVVVFPVQQKWRKTSPDYQIFKSSPAPENIAPADNTKTQANRKENPRRSSDARVGL